MRAEELTVSAKTFANPCADQLRSLSSRKAYAVAFFVGALLTLAFPPFQLLPVLCIAFPMLIWLIEGLESDTLGNSRRAFVIGWWFGVGHHITGLYWITIALGIDGGKFLWVVPFALLLLPAYLSLFIGFCTWAFHRTHLRGLSRLLLFGVCWVTAEYLRSVILGGFPWNLMGYVWTISTASLQPASLVGVYGLSLWAVLLGVSFSAFSPFTAVPRPAHSLFPLYALVFTALLVGWGEIRLRANPAEIQDKTNTSMPWIRVVQGNIDQAMKWSPWLQQETLQTHIDLSRGGWAERKPLDPQPRPDYIVWPETSMPFPFDADSEWVQSLGKLSEADGALITGVTRVKDARSPHWQIWNSVQVVSGGEHPALVDVYDKVKLVPFGEFLPLRAFFDWFNLSKVTHGSVDFSTGEGPRYLTLPGKAPLVQPLICYETIFPFFHPFDQEKRPDWLLNVTNDAWFGDSTGPYQQFQMARTRAVEQGAPMIRAANSGISGAIDPYGRVINKLPLNVPGAFTVKLPHKTESPTFYARYSEFTVLLISYFLLLYAFRSRV